MDLISAGNRFAKSHRIRVDISGSNYSYFDLNTNTGERPGYTMHVENASNTVYHDASHPSHLNFSVMPVSPAAP